VRPCYRTRTLFNDYKEKSALETLLSAEKKQERTLQARRPRRTRQAPAAARARLPAPTRRACPAPLPRGGVSTVRCRPDGKRFRSQRILTAGPVRSSAAVGKEIFAPPLPAKPRAAPDADW